MNNCTERWIKEYKKRGALWLHDNNPVRPHALLTSGKHSGGFFNSGLVLEDPFLLDKACQDLLVLLTGAGCTVYKDVHRVVGPAMGAITLAHSLAYRIAGVTFSSQCFCSYTEKEVLDGENTMVFKRTSVKDGESVLAVEDVLTTGGSVDLTTTAIEKKAESSCLTLSFL